MFDSQSLSPCGHVTMVPKPANHATSIARSDRLLKFQSPRCSPPKKLLRQFAEDSTLCRLDDELNFTFECADVILAAWTP